MADQKYLWSATRLGEEARFEVYIAEEGKLDLGIYRQTYDLEEEPTLATVPNMKADAIKLLSKAHPGISKWEESPGKPTTKPATNNVVADEGTKKEKPTEDLNPTDPRLVFAVGKAKQVVYSFGAGNEHPLTDGMVFGEGEKGDGKKKPARDFKDGELDVTAKDFFGPPALLNPNSYINLQGAGGKGNNKYLIDRENGIRWYNITEPNSGSGSGVESSTAPTVSEIVRWSLTEDNEYKFPYKFTDFAFCKWWKKIPNNYMITLRRYPYPVNDAVTSGAEARGSVEKKENLKPVATMITFLGEDPGNKISSILGPIETGLNWEDFTADVWSVSTSGEAASANNPAPNMAKMLGFLQTGDARTGERVQPVDPYTNGPYINKIIGPVNVIDTTKGRKRGLMFKHSMNLVFEYSLRGIGGINTKAAGLDIIGNAMLMSSASASFWGGANRHVPNAGHGQTDPFLGGADGLAAWLRGDPAGFMTSLKNQFLDIGKNLDAIFNKMLSGSPTEALSDLAAGGAALFMKNSTTKSSMVTTGIHSLLTGAPVGEWHVCVGPPQNPMMMMGNMICTGSKLEFSDELGPDDFPAEIKITITLEHGMPRDKDAIESMFNKGRGRIYSLPKGYEKSFASSSQSPIDTSIKPKYHYTRNDSSADANTTNGKTPDKQKDADTNAAATSKDPVVSTVFGTMYAQGYGYEAAFKK
jgi:hypothetical protein